MQGNAKYVSILVSLQLIFRITGSSQDRMETSLKMLRLPASIFTLILTTWYRELLIISSKLRTVTNSWHGSILSDMRTAERAKSRWSKRQREVECYKRSKRPSLLPLECLIPQKPKEELLQHFPLKFFQWQLRPVDFKSMGVWVVWTPLQACTVLTFLHLRWS
jgi:hypothetical protein